MIFTKLFGSKNDRTLKNFSKIVNKINDLESEWQNLSDDALKNKTVEFKQRLEQGETLESILIEAFATVREASVRVFNMRHFDVQLLGGIVLMKGNIAEMRTGEGKTLTATLPAYLHALTGKSVHIVTVNDYLAKRDAEWNEPLFNFLGLSVGINLSRITINKKKEAYLADITYGTNNEFGFDFLRDNMAYDVEDRVQRDLSFALVDEVDSILIDEARTPLIISGSVEDSSEAYIKINALIPNLQQQDKEDNDDYVGEGDFTVDEKSKQVHLTERGLEKIEGLLEKNGILNQGESLYSAANISLMHHVNAGLRAHYLYEKDVDYIVNENQDIVIVDEHTGRLMPGRRWSDGLHQAVEAKENVPIQSENQTLASITFQNYFRMYDTLSGMTGTADTEAFEFLEIYGLDTIVIPTNKPMIRQDLKDSIYLTQKEKFQAVIEDIQKCKKREQPVLVGTISIEASEYLSALLKKKNIVHKVLNAKFHEKEAEIISEAGRPGAVTIATNMAGRGTDIVLGGNLKVELTKVKNLTPEKEQQITLDWQERHKKVLELGGLHIIASERHESRRIDNQLRGRAGRQGDPGSSHFYLSMEDSLMRIFSSERILNMMKKLGMEEGESIEHKWVDRAVENAQRKVEARNFDIRKQLLEYDDIANEQRQVIYRQRKSIMEEEDVSGIVYGLVDDVLNDLIMTHLPPQTFQEMWNVSELENLLKVEMHLTVSIQDWLKEDKQLLPEDIVKKVYDLWKKQYQEKEKQVGVDIVRQFEKSVLLQTLDVSWKEHLSAMDHLRQGIHLRGYAQKNPKQEYKRESFELFTRFLDTYKQDVLGIVSRVQVRKQEDVDALEKKRKELERKMQTKQKLTHEEDVFTKTKVRDMPKVGRNEPCPCNSGKKYKHCHGKILTS